MTDATYTFVGLSRSYGERRLYIDLRGCPICASPVQASVKTNWALTRIADREFRAGYYDVTCGGCGHVRKYLFECDVAADSMLQDHFIALYRAAGLTYKIGNDGPPALKRQTLHLGPLGVPSMIIEPHELAREVARRADAVPDGWIRAPYAEFATVYAAAYYVLQYVYELHKFLPEGEASIPERYIRSAEAANARVAHPEWFQRDWIEGQIAYWEPVFDASRPEGAARLLLPATDPRSSAYAKVERAPMLPPLTRGSAVLHEAWLKGHGGEALVARKVEASDAQLSGRDLSSSTLDDVTLDRANLSFARFHAASFVKVRAREANFSDALFAGATIVGCDFTRSELGLAKFGDATITETTFESAALERTTWYRTTIANCSFRSADLRSAAFDKARVTDCDFRGATFAVDRKLLGTMWDAVFIRCDFRDTDWTDVDLFRARFVQCKFAGARGAPKLAETVFEDVDVELVGAPAPAPELTVGAPVTKVELDLPDEEAAVAVATASLLCWAVQQAPIRHGTELWTRLDIFVPTGSSGREIDEALIAYRARQRHTTGSAGERAEHLLDELSDLGATFEDTVAALMKTGLTREQAMEAVIDPSSLDA